MNVLIVDDEPLALEVLENYISRFPDLKLSARCNNAIEAFEALNSKKIDLMFLDIQMPQISGIDFLKTLQNPPKVIFTTAFPNYALEGYELNVVDYLLKPIAFDRFSKAVNKFLDLYSTQANEEPEEEKPDFIFVKADKLPSEIFMRVHRSYIVNLTKIEMMESNALLVNKKNIPIGKNHRDELLLVINKNRL